MGGGRERTQRKKEGECLSQCEPETEALQQTQEILFVSYFCTSPSFFLVAYGFLSFVVDMTGKIKAYSA